MANDKNPDRKKGKKGEKLTFVQTMQKFAHAGISESPPPNRTPNNLDSIESLEDRIQMILGIINGKNRKPTNMLFFVMYDIASNKVRHQVVKYLIRKGCTRVQRSIFLADLDTSIYEEIRNDLTEVQAAYENEDSILIVPLSTDYLRAMRIIGQSIELDVITHTKSTLFF